MSAIRDDLKKFLLDASAEDIAALILEIRKDNPELAETLLTRLKQQAEEPSA